MSAVPNSDQRLRVLLVPDWIQWITGTLAQSVARFNPWIDATILSARVADQLLTQRESLRDNFDLVHFTCSYASKKWVPLLSGRMPCVTSHHHVSDWEAQKHNLEGDAVVVSSRQWENDLLQRGLPKERIFRLPYGVDAKKFRPPSAGERTELRRRLGIPPAHVAVGFFAKQSSNEMQRKGTDIFSAAVVALHKEIDFLTVVIVGPGWDGFVRSLAASGLHCLYYPFIQTTEELAKIYRVLDFYWVTARVEGGPVPLLEAMSSGVCCLSTPVGLAPDIIQNGTNALLLETEQSAQFVAQTVQLARNPSQRLALGRNARETILQSMDLPLIYRDVVKLYQLAFANFSRRTGRLPVVTPAPSPVEGSCPEFTEMPLCGVPQNLRRTVRLMEKLTWADALIAHGQKTEALISIGRECLLQPASTLAWRFMLRHLLPKPLVATLVKHKNA